MAIDYSEQIPNNVNLAENRRLQRALEQWQPGFLRWWRELGPLGFQTADVYLRTAISVDAEGWATFGYVQMPEYRWGIFLADAERNRNIAFGQHKGGPVWQDVPGEHRSTLRRLIVTQGDTEPASVEQQRQLGATPSADPGRLQRTDAGLVVILHVHLFHRPRRQISARQPRRVGLRSALTHMPFHAHRGSSSHVRG